MWKDILKISDYERAVAEEFAPEDVSKPMDDMVEEEKNKIREKAKETMGWPFQSPTVYQYSPIHAVDDRWRAEKRAFDEMVQSGELIPRIGKIKKIPQHKAHGGYKYTGIHYYNHVKFGGD
jgi:hypothetical protein